MRKNKGQVTLYIIIAIIIMFLIGGVLIFTKYIRQQDSAKSITEIQNLGSNSDAPKVYVDECIKAKISKGSELLGLQGGLLNAPNPYLNSDFSRVAYGLYQNKVTLPKKEEIENDLEKIAVVAAESCLNYSLFGYVPSVGPIKSSVKINDNSFSVKINASAKIKKGDLSISINELDYVIDKRIGYMHSALSIAISKIIKDDGWIDFAYLSSLGLTADIIPHNETNLILSLKDPQKNFVFNTGLQISKNSPPTISIDKNIRVNQHSSYYQKVDVSDRENDKIACSDDTALFDITEDCEISFEAHIPGSYKVTITATDSHQEFSQKEVIFEVS